MRQSIKQLILTFLLLLIGVTTLAFVLPSFPSDGYTGDPYYEGGYSIVQPGRFNMLGVSGYTEDGVMHDDGSPDHETGVWGHDEFWNNADRYTYYWDEYDGQWWRTDGKRWWIWVNVLGWHWTILDYGEPKHPVQRAYQENPCPLDGETYILISLALLAFAGKFYYQKKKFQTISNSAV